jgi:predicted RNase H-like HicB family nuclease
MATKNTYTAVITKDPKGGYVGQVIDHPEALEQGETLQEVEKNLTSALKDVLNFKREEYEKGVKRKKIKSIKRKIVV